MAHSLDIPDQPEGHFRLSGQRFSDPKNLRFEDQMEPVLYFPRIMLARYVELLETGAIPKLGRCFLPGSVT